MTSTGNVLYIATSEGNLGWLNLVEQHSWVDQDSSAKRRKVKGISDTNTLGEQRKVVNKLVNFFGVEVGAIIIKTTEPRLSQEHTSFPV